MLEHLMPLRQFTDQCHLPQSSFVLLRGRTAPGRTVGNVVHDSTSSREADAVTNRSVIGNATCATNSASIADRDASRDARKARNHASAADPNIVSNLAEVVDLRHCANGSCAKLAPIDTSARAHFHIVAKFHMPDVRDFRDAPACRICLVTESVGTNVHASVQHNAIAKSRPFAERDIAVEDTVRSHARVGIHMATVVKDGARSDDGARANRDERADVRRWIHLCRRVDDGHRMPSNCGNFRWSIKCLQQLEHRVISVLHADERPPRAGVSAADEILIENDDAGAACGDHSCVSAITNERDIAHLRFVHEGESAGDGRAIAVEHAAHECGDFLRRLRSISHRPMLRSRWGERAWWELSWAQEWLRPQRSRCS